MAEQVGMTDELRAAAIELEPVPELPNHYCHLQSSPKGFWTLGPVKHGGMAWYVNEAAVKLALFPRLRSENAKQAASNKGLRLRIHMLEKHNQHFERCESGWCNPSEQGRPGDDPATEIWAGYSAEPSEECAAPAARIE
ncbi:MAG TPA: hypothetical protein VNH19_05730 [Candidatus Limnocylindrales bacterium]|nr:hypothetical protein [Candidatus Limnocylindrales bacterium]